MKKIFLCGRFKFTMNRPLIMGIINITPNSFNTRNKFKNLDQKVYQATKLINDGADIIDIGGESTRPGSDFIKIEEEILRILPLIKVLYEKKIPMSIDTYKYNIMKLALDSGIDMVNNVYGFNKFNSLNCLRKSNCGFCISHIHGISKNMQENNFYTNLTKKIGNFIYFQSKVFSYFKINPKRIVIDLGFGFGKTQINNYQLLHKLNTLSIFQYPIMVGISSKYMLGHILKLKKKNRLTCELSSIISCLKGNNFIIRTHNVKKMIKSIKVLKIIEKACI